MRAGGRAAAMRRRRLPLLIALAALHCEAAAPPAPPPLEPRGDAAAVRHVADDGRTREPVPARAGATPAPQPSASPSRAAAPVSPSSATRDEGGEQSIESKVERAVVKIELFKGKRSMSFGTGFFISSDGLLATNYHVISDALERHHEPVFSLDRAQTTTRKFEVIRCMDPRDMDLCVLKLDYRPSHYLEVGERRPRIGEDVFSIGNPKGSDFSLERGTVASVYRDIHRAVKINDYSRNRRVEMIRLNADLRKGFSGGPVVSADGELLGINSVILHPPEEGGEKLVLAITAREMHRYLRKKAPFDLERFTQAQVKKNTILTTPADQLTEAQIKKACKTLQKDECIAGIKAACRDGLRKAECERLRSYFRALVEK